MKEIFTSKAAAAAGPYSQAIEALGFIFTSGQLPINPVSGEIDQDDIVWQANQVFSNVKVILEEAGAGFENVVKSTIFLKDMNDFATVNKLYGELFAKPFPARSCFQVGKLPKDAMIEMEVIALKTK